MFPPGTLATAPQPSAEASAPGTATPAAPSPAHTPPLGPKHGGGSARDVGALIKEPAAPAAAAAPARRNRFVGPLFVFMIKEFATSALVQTWFRLCLIHDAAFPTPLR